MPRRPLCPTLSLSLSVQVRQSDFGCLVQDARLNRTPRCRILERDAHRRRGGRPRAGYARWVQHTLRLLPPQSVTFDCSSLIPRLTPIFSLIHSSIADKADYFNLKGVVAVVKSDKISYPAHSSQCLKKVVEDGHSWRCEKCDVVVEQPEYRSVGLTPLFSLVLDHGTC